MGKGIESMQQKQESRKAESSHRLIKRGKMDDEEIRRFREEWNRVTREYSGVISVMESRISGTELSVGTNGNYASLCRNGCDWNQDSSSQMLSSYQDKKTGGHSESRVKLASRYFSNGAKWYQSKYRLSSGMCPEA